VKPTRTPTLPQFAAALYEARAPDDTVFRKKGVPDIIQRLRFILHRQACRMIAVRDPRLREEGNHTGRTLFLRSLRVATHSYLVKSVDDIRDCTK
jgi:hypothetical protein